MPEDAFRDADPGDVLNLSARLAGGQPLPPRWVQFDEATGVPRHLSDGYSEEVTIEVVASDVDGTQAASIFVMRRASRPTEPWASVSDRSPSQPRRRARHPAAAAAS